MGCATSKLDDLPAVTLCRDRCAFLDEAIRRRFAFAEAHAAYLQSLKAVGLSIDRFFSQHLDSSSLGGASPVLNLPPTRKGDPDHHLYHSTPDSSPDEIQHHLHSHSDSGSHLHFHSESDDGSGSESLHHHDAPTSPVHQQESYGGYFPVYGNLNFNSGGGGVGFMNINYMKSQTTPSVVYTQRPMNPEMMHMGESSFSSSAYNPNYAINNNNDNQYAFSSNFDSYPNPNPGGGFFGGSSAPSWPAVASSSKLLPPPPPPPTTTTWDFLDPFEASEKYYPVYPIHDSREVREEEGIPDLEDEEDDVVKEVHGDQKANSKPVPLEQEAPVINDGNLKHKATASVGTETAPAASEVPMMSKRSKEQGDVAGYKCRDGFKGDFDVLREIKVQFERASESGSELAKFLEVGKLPYKWKNNSHHVSSKLLHLPPSMSKNTVNADPAFLEVDQEMMLRSKNLSSTLHKLYLWEKKLYEEVKAEEKMRVLHESKSRKLKHLDERGAEANKVDVTRTLVRSLSTKIKIAIQVVDKISVKINSLRDDELWPQLNEFLQGLTRMWKAMLECHRNQCQAIEQAKELDSITGGNLEATRQLEYDLINWTLTFSSWVDAQKVYVRSMNNWLMKCLLYVPEETDDGPVPFSPGRMGAPTMFVVCNQWSRLLDRISEKEVVDSMRDLAVNVLRLWDRDKEEMHQRMLANKEDRKIKSLEKEDEKIQKEFQALDKRMVVTGNSAVYESETSKGGSLQASLRLVVGAMEKFTANSLKVYEELLQRIEEEGLVQEHVS